jgi:hypothetical protein
MLRLADTSVRLYRKKDGRASFRLRSYLMIDTSVGFRLSAYLKELSCKLTLPSGEDIVFEEISFSEDLICKHQLNTMVHDLWASASADIKEIRNGVGKLRIDYRISFTGHEAEGSSLKVGSMTLRRRAVARCRPGFVEAVLPPPCPSCSVLRSGPR